MERAQVDTAQLFERRFDIALLTGTVQPACEALMEDPTLSPDLGKRIFCMARNDAYDVALTTLDTGFDKVTTAQTVLGSRMAWLEIMSERRVDNVERITEERSVMGGADPAVTMTRLQEMMTVLEASQASFVRLANLNLFSMLR